MPGQFGAKSSGHPKPWWPPRRWTARAAVPPWSASHTQSQPGTDGDAVRKKKRERKKETGRWTPVPHVSGQENNPLCTSILSSGDQSLVSPVFRRKILIQMILGMALPLCEPIIGGTDIYFSFKGNHVLFQNLCIHVSEYTSFLK